MDKDFVPSDLFRPGDYVLIGPVCWRFETPISAKKTTYCICVCGDPTGSDGSVIKIEFSGESQERDRATFISWVISQNKGIVVQSFDDELEMAKMCKEIWPIDRFIRIYEDTLRERQFGVN